MRKTLKVFGTVYIGMVMMMIFFHLIFDGLILGSIQWWPLAMLVGISTPTYIVVSVGLIYFIERKRRS